MKKARISAVVVTHNHRVDVEACLASLLASSRPPDEIIVADQLSSDGTPDLIRRRFPRVILLEHGENAGFATGNNRAFRVASGDHLFLLNPDATVDPGAIERLAQALDRDPKLGAAVPKTLLAGERIILNGAGLSVTRIGYACDRGYLEYDEGQYDQEQPVVAGSGCALLLRTQAVHEVGGFDDAFFMYYEDLDLCLRLWLHGYSVRYVPSAVARHSAGIHHRPAHYGEYLDHRNRLRMLFKGLELRTLLRLAPALAGFELRAVLARLHRRQWRYLGLRIRAWAWNLLHLPSTVRLRRALQRGRMVSDGQVLDLMEPWGGSPRLETPVPDYPPLLTRSPSPPTIGPVLCMGESEPGLGLGWHGLEEWDGERFRWTGRYGIAFLESETAGPPGALRVLWRSLSPLDIWVSVGDLAAVPFKVEPDAWRWQTLPWSPGPGLLRIEIRAPEPIIPSERIPRSRDRRALGVAVARLMLVPGPGGSPHHD